MRRRAALALVVAAVLAQAACGNRESIRGGGTTVGTTLTIYSSLPSPARGSSRDIVEGEKLALAEAHGKAGEYTINFSSLDEAGGRRAAAERRAAEAARTAMVDTQTAAVIGTVDSAGARASIPLLNAAGFLHVSLGAGYPGFTGRLGPDEPQRWFPAGGRTFARLVGDDRAQAPALVRAAGTRRVVVEAEGGEDAAALAAEVRRAAAAAGVKVVTKAGRDSAVIYAGQDPLAAAEVAASIARETPGARVVLPDAVVRNGVEAALRGAGGAPRRARLERAASRARPRRCASSRPPSSAPTGAARALRRARPRGDGDRARRARPRRRRRPRRRAPAGDARVLLRRRRGHRRRAAVRAALRRRRAAAVHRVPFAEGGSRLGVPAMSSAASTTSQLNPTITRTMLTVFVIGDVLGAGIYALVGEVGGEVGGAIWAAFLLAGVLALFTAASYAELVTKYPQAAGAALYVHRAFKSDFFTFVVAFAVMASGVTSAATLATAFGGDYLSEFVDLPTVLVGLVFIGVITLINFRGIKESVGVNLGLTTIELFGLLLVVVIGLAFLLDGGGDPGRALEFKEGEAVPIAILGGASLAFFALIGFEDSVNVAEETKDPSRVFPRALFLGLGIAGVVYMLVTVIASMAVPTAELVELGRPAAGGRRPGPARRLDQAVRRDRAVRADQRRADQPDHGLAAGLRHEPRGDRPRGARPGPRRPQDAVGGDPLRRRARRPC